jgi:hypothetical protein
VRTVAAADPRTESRAAFARGVSEAHKNHFTAARDAFLEAYRLFPHPSILLNLGVARMHTGEYVAAEADLSKFLTDDGGASAEDRANGKATLLVVRKHLGTFRLRVTPASARATLDSVPVTLVPGSFADVRAIVGPGQLHVEAEGFLSIDREVLVSKDTPLAIDLEMTRAGATVAPLPPPPPEIKTERHTTLGWGLIGGGAAVAAVGVIAGVEALSLAHDYNTPGIPGYQEASTRTEGLTWRTSADVLFATALGLGAAGTYFLVKPVPVTTTGTSLVVGPGSVALSGSF